MISKKRWFSALFVLAIAGGDSLHGQARPTAERRLRPSAFAMLEGKYTDIGGSPYNMLTTDSGLGGRNLTLSAGMDLVLYAAGSFDIGLEGRGSYPLNKGRIDGQKSLLGGVRVSREPQSTSAAFRLRPYMDVLAGRGAIEYLGGGYATPGLIYLNSNSFVYGAGGGFEVDVSQHFSIKADAQIEHWNTPISLLGPTHPFMAGVGLVYRIGAGDGPR